MVDPFESDDTTDQFVQHSTEYYKVFYTNISEKISEPIYPKGRVHMGNSPL